MNIDDITYQIRGAVFEVNRVLGHGFLEKVYEKALMTELNSRGLSVGNQVPLKVIYKEKIDGSAPEPETIRITPKANGFHITLITNYRTTSSNKGLEQTNQQQHE